MPVGKIESVFSVISVLKAYNLMMASSRLGRLWKDLTLFVQAIISPVPKRKSEQGEGSQILSGKRILLVDDAPESQILITHILQKFGMLVDVAENGRKALDILNDEDFDLILMDMQMPVLDGYSTTEILRRTGYRKPIISLTAHALREDQIRCLTSGCNEVLTKPINHLMLVDAIGRYFK